MQDINQNIDGATTALQDRVLNYLRGKGINPVTVNQCIHFNYLGLNFLFLFDDDMPNYFRFAIPNVMENYTNNLGIYKIIDRLNAKYKVVKAYTYPLTSSLWIVAEQFTDNFFFENLLDRLMSILKNYYTEFRNTVISNG